MAKNVNVSRFTKPDGTKIISLRAGDDGGLGSLDDLEDLMSQAEDHQNAYMKKLEVELCRQALDQINSGAPIKHLALDFKGHSMSDFPVLFKLINFFESQE